MNGPTDPWVEPDIGTRWAWESEDDLERDAMRLALRSAVAGALHPYAREPFIGPHAVNLDAEEP